MIDIWQMFSVYSYCCGKKRNIKKDYVDQATFEKLFVSCPAGGQNCGQSGGRNRPPPLFFFGGWGVGEGVRK